MPWTGKNDERTEQVPRGDKKLTKAEPLHQTKPVRKLRVKVEAKLKKTIVDLEEKFGDNKDRLIHELGVHQIELETQNEELCRAQQELEDSRNRYSNLYDLAPVGYFTFDKNACVVEANLTGCQMLGVERAYLIKKPFHIYISEDCQDRFYLHRRQVFETDTRQSCEISLVTKDGEKFEVLLESVKAADADGNLSLFRTTITDITELNIAEKVRNLAKFPSENPYPILRIHKNGTVLYANKASEPFLKAKSTTVGLPAPPEWRRLVKNALSSGQVIREENTLDNRVFSLRAVPITENDYVNFYGTDITEQRIAQEEREITIKLLSLINSKNHIHDLMKLVTSLLKDWSGCEAVGIRLQDGEDFPYFETSGFPEDFVQAESKLCSWNELGEPLRDSNGRAYLECMCGNIISGRFDPLKPFFTERGSFWSNCTTALLASTTNADRMAKTRNRCNAAGYESVALVPLRTGNETFGLLQFNSRQKNKFTPEKISLLEHLADNLAIGLSQRKTEESLRRSETRYRSLFGNMLNGFAYCRMIYERGRPQDFIYLDVNESFEKMTGLKNVTGRRVTEVIPGIKEAEPELFEIYGRVALTGKPEQFEINFHPLNMWLSVSVYSPEKEHFVAIFENITERKKAEEALRVNHEDLDRAQAVGNIGSWRLDIRKNELTWSDENHRIFGIPRGTPLTYEIFLSTVHPDDRDYVDKKWKAGLAGEDYDIEHRLLVDGQVKWVREKAYLEFHSNGELLGGFGITQDITERKQAEESLQEKSRLNQMLLDSMPCVALLMRPKSREIVALNKMAVEAGAAIGKTCFQTWARRQAPCPWCLAPETWVTGQASHLTVEHAGIWWDAHWVPIAEDLYMHYAFDVTKEKIAEQAILESEERLKAALNAAELGIWDWDLVGGQLKWEGHHARLFGFKEGEFDGRFETFEKRVHPDDIAGLKAAVEKAKKEQTEYFYEYRVIWPDGTVRWLTGKGRCRYNQTGQAVRMLGTVQDITEHRQAEEALLASETRYRRLFEAARDGILILDADSGLIVDVNPFIEKMLGYSHEEFLNKHLWEIGLFKNIAASKEAFLELQDKGYVRYDNMPLKTKDGRQIAVEFVSNVYIVDRRKVIQCNIRDITERALAEQTLQISEIRFRELFNNMSSGVAVYDAVDDGNDFIIKDFNAAGEKMEKISRENIIGRKVTEVFPGVKPMGLLDVFSRVWRTGKPEHHPTALYKDDRLSSWRENYVYKLLSGEIVAAYDDVTERQTALECLQEERNLLRTLIDHIPDDIYIKDRDSRFLLYNKTVAEYWSKRGKYDLIGKTDFDLFPQATAQMFFDEERKVMTTNQPLSDSERTHSDGKGSFHHFLTTKVPLKDNHGNITGIVGINRDITNLKLTDKTLRESEAILKESQRVAQLGHYVLDAASGKFTSSEALDEIFGIDKTYPKTIEGWLNLLHPEHKDEMRDYLMVHVLKDGQPFDRDYRIIRQNDKAVRWMHGLGKLEMNATGQPVRMFGTIQDITESKMTEEQLQNERNLLRNLIDHIPSGIYVKDNDSRFILYNKAVAEYWGTKGQIDLIGKTDFDILPQAAAQSYLDEEQKIMSTNQPLIDREGTCTDSRGNLHHFLTTKIPLQDTHGKTIGIVGVNNDITTIKMFEAVLLDHQKHLKRLASRLITVEEQERRRIATNIHDDISQTLAMAKIKLDKLRHSSLPETTASVIEEVTHFVEQVIHETRTLTFDLSNPILYELGFEVAVAEWLSENVGEKHGIATDFQDDGRPKPLDDDLKAMLFRNTRELLTNCIKHASAKNITVKIRRIDETIQITVEDNGVGFDLAQIKATANKKGKFGLFSVRENMENTGGSFEIESKPGAGCKAVMTAPLKNQNGNKET